MVSSADHGTTWRTSLPGGVPDIHYVVADPARPERLTRFCWPRIPVLEHLTGLDDLLDTGAGCIWSHRVCGTSAPSRCARVCHFRSGFSALLE